MNTSTQRMLDLIRFLKYGIEISVGKGIPIESLWALALIKILSVLGQPFSSFFFLLLFSSSQHPPHPGSFSSFLLLYFFMSVCLFIHCKGFRWLLAIVGYVLPQTGLVLKWSLVKQSISSSSGSLWRLWQK